MLNDLIKLFSLLSTLEPVHTANGHQALQACVDRIRIIGTQQLKCDVQETWPLLWEVMLKNFLEKRDELGANVRRRRCEGRNQPFSEPWLLLLGNRCLQGAIFDRSPTPIDSVLQVNTSYRENASIKPSYYKFKKSCFPEREKTYPKVERRLSAPPAKYPKAH